MTTLEHVGIAVNEPDAVRSLLRDLLGLRHYKSETVDREQVETHFICAGETKIELLEALGPESPVAKFISKRGQGVHHLAFEVDSVEEAIRRGRALGLTPLSPEGRPGADRKRIAFFHPRDTYGLLIEVCESLPSDVEDPMDDASVTAFGVVRSPAVVVACLDGAGHSGLWIEVAGMLETRFYVILVIGPAARARELIDGVVAGKDPMHLILEPPGQDWARDLGAARGGELRSTLVCDLGREGEPVRVRSGSDRHAEYVIPALEGGSRASVRLLAGLLERLLSSDPGT